MMITHLLCWLSMVVVAVGGESLTLGLTDLDATVEVQNFRPRIAEAFDVQIQLAAPAGTRVKFPQLGSQFGPFTVLHSDDRFNIPDEQNADRRIWTRLLTLESLQTGELVIPEMAIEIEAESGSREIRSQAQTVEVISVLENQVDPLKFRDIKDAVDIEASERTSYAWIAWAWAGLGWRLYSVLPCCGWPVAENGSRRLNGP